MATTIFHELYGHAATRALFGGEWLAKQNALLDAIGGGEGLYRLAAANQIDLHAYADGLAADTSLTDAERRAIMMDELLAHLAEKPTVLRQRINAFIGAVRAWLRVHGFAKLAEYGNTDLAHLLASARDSLAAKAAGRAGLAMPVFARDADHAPMFYSALARQIGKTVTKAASPLHWAETIMGTSFAQQGVKQDEIQWSGVLDWLLMQKEAGVAKVGRAQLLDYLAQNGVRVDEIIKGDPSEDEIQLLLDDEAGEGMTREDAVDYLRAGEDSAKWEKYVLPGGENYRELLLTLPQKAHTRDDFVTLSPDGTPFGVHPTEDAARAVAAQIGGTYQAGSSTSWEPAKYRSQHWDEANVLAHIRFDERIDADGDKVLFVQELQSDWAQQGKREGFGATQRYSIRDQDGNVRGDFDSAAAAQAYLDHPPSFVDPTRSAVIASESVGVAHAPFVGNTEAWVGLAIKRVIRYAAEHGYDKVAFINGAQSAERYDMSKRVDWLYWTGQTLQGGKGNIADENASPNLIDAVVPRAKLADWVGKELADKLIAQHDAHGGAATLTGLDLVVGGAGMKAFYDKIVPNTANDVLKKLGGDRLGTVEIGNVRSRSVEDIGITMLDGGAYIYGQIDGEALFWTGRNWSNLFESAQMYPSYDEASVETVHRLRSLVQPGFAISDALRARAQAGLPLFARATPDALVFSGNELGGKDQPMAQLRSKAREAARRFASKTVTVAADGAQIQMPWTGIRHALSGNVDFVTAVVATKLDQLIERGSLAKTVPDNKGRPEVKAIHYYDTPVVIGGEPSVVRIVVREMSDGKRYYDHFENREAAADGGSENLPGNEPGPSSLQPASEANSSIDDPRKDGGPLFARSPQQISQQVGGTIKGMLGSVKNKGVDYRSLLLQMLGREQLVEVYGEQFPQGPGDNTMRQYNKLATVRPIPLMKNGKPMLRRASI